MADLSVAVGRELAWWETISLTSSGEIHWIKKPTQEGKEWYSTITESYAETRDNRRVLDKVMAFEDGRQKRTLDVLDHDKAFTIVYDPATPKKQKLASIHHAFALESSNGESARPVPLKYFYVGKIPLHEALSTGQVIGEANTNLGKFTSVQFNNVLWSRMPQNLRYSIHNTAALPVRIESFSGDYPARKTHWIWEVDEFDSIQGHPWPSRSTLTTFDLRGDITRKVQYRTSDVRFNSDLTGRFDHTLQPGVETHDTIIKQTLNSPRNTNTSKPVPVGSAVSAPPAVMPTSWTSYLPMVGFTLGLALLCCALLTSVVRKR